MKGNVVLIFITHSLGELDVLLPLLASRNTKYKAKFVFTVENVFSDYQKSRFLRYAVSKLDVDVEYLLLPNKFDKRYRRVLDNRILSRFARILFALIVLGKTLFLVKHLRQASCYMHEFSTQRFSTMPLYFGAKVFGKPIATYDHGHAVRLSQAPPKKKRHFAQPVQHLLFHEHNRETFLNLGFNNYAIVGYPKFHRSWKDIIKEYHGEEIGRCVVIFSRHVHPFYMDEGNYQYLLVSAYEVVRAKLGDIPILIKPHPRENVQLIGRIINANRMENIQITQENPSWLSRFALFTIAFWGSVILDSLAMNCPAVEYYREARRFRETEIAGSSYRNLRIDSVDNPAGLSAFINSVLEGEYVRPKMVSELSSHAKVHACTPLFPAVQ